MAPARGEPGAMAARFSTLLGPQEQGGDEGDRGAARRRVRLDLGDLPFEACPTSIGGVPTLCTITSRPPGMLGGRLWPGDPGNWSARERPALAGWLAAHPASRSGVDVGERRRNRAGLARNGERDVGEGDGPDKDLGLLRARALEGEVFNTERLCADVEAAPSLPRRELL